MRAMQVAVTGGLGRLGQYVVRALAPHTVRVLDIGPPADCVVADLRDLAALRAALRGVEVVVHLGGIDRSVATDDAATNTKTTSAAQAPAVLRPAVPISKPDARQMKSTLGLMTASNAPAPPARAGVMELIARSQAGECSERWRVSHCQTPNTMSAAPSAMRSHDAHDGGLSRPPPNRSDNPMNTTVSAASPTTQPARKARPAGLGRGVCRTSTAGMTDSGDAAMISASGTTSARTEPQLSATFALPNCG